MNENETLTNDLSSTTYKKETVFDIEFCKKAIKEKDYESINQRGLSLLKDNEYDDSKKYLILASIFGYAPAIYNLGLYYEKWYYFDDCYSYLNIDYAYSYYLRACDLHYYKAYSRISKMFETGDFFRVDYKHAYKLALKGAKLELKNKNAGECCNLVGDFLSSNKIKRKSYKKALEYYNYAIENNYKEAMYNAAMIYLYKDKKSKDIGKGIDLLIKSSRLSYSRSYIELFKIYHKGEIVKKDELKANEYLNEAINKNLCNDILFYVNKSFISNFFYDNPEDYKESKRILSLFALNNFKKPIAEYNSFKKEHSTSLNWDDLERNANYYACIDKIKANYIPEK